MKGYQGLRLAGTERAEDTSGRRLAEDTDWRFIGRPASLLPRFLSVIMQR